MSTPSLSADSTPLKLSNERFDPLLVVTIGVMLGPAPLAVLHLRTLWQKEQYQFFPFVIAAVIWLLVSRWHEGRKVDSPPRWPALPWVLVGCAVVLLLGAVLTVSGWLAFVSLNVALGAVFWWLGRRRHITYLWGIWSLLWLLVPLPLRVDERVVAWLQGVSSRLSSSVLDMAGILHVMSGNVLKLPQKELFVAEACSGIVSVMSIVACSMIYAIYRNRSVIHLVLLTFMGICWAVVMNLARICTIAAALHWWNIDWSEGTPHELLSLVLFLAAFLALVSSDFLLAAMLTPIDLQKISEKARESRLIRAWNWLLVRSPDRVSQAGQNAPAIGDVRLREAVVATAAFAILAILQISWLPSADTAEARAAVDRALAIDKDFLPKQIGAWELEDFKGVEREALDEFGKFSRTYTFRHVERPTLHATLSLDFPYVGGWHDLCMCYRGNGWETRERKVVSEAGPDSDWQFVEADLNNPDGTHAALAFTGFDVSGLSAEPPTSAVLFRPWFRLRRRLLQQIVPQLFQVQVLAVGDETTDEKVQSELRELLLQTRTRFRDQIATAKK